MLKKVNRLAKAKDIKKAFAQGRTFFSPFFSIKYVSGPNQRRFAVVVSTKVFKQAVKRNRLKRIIREHIRKNLINFKTGIYVIIAKPKISGVTNEAALENFINLCAKFA